MKQPLHVAPEIARSLPAAVDEAPVDLHALDKWLTEPIEGSACSFCKFGPLTRFERLNGRCERCRERYLAAAEGGRR